MAMWPTLGDDGGVTSTDQASAPATRTATDVRVTAEPSRQRYELFDGDTMIGMLVYGLPDEVHVDIVHTEVDPEYGGQGLAGLLTEFAVKDIQVQGKRVVPHCPYVRNWLAKRPEFEAIVDLPA